MIDWLLNPATGLTVFLALIWTLAIHFMMGLGFKGILWHWILACAGMAAGYGVAVRTQSHLPMVGDVHVIESTSVALALLILAGLRAKMASGRPLARPQKQAAGQPRT